MVTLQVKRINSVFVDLSYMYKQYIFHMTHANAAFPINIFLNIEIFFLKYYARVLQVQHAVESKSNKNSLRTKSQLSHQIFVVRIGSIKMLVKLRMKSSHFPCVKNIF